MRILITANEAGYTSCPNSVFSPYPRQVTPAYFRQPSFRYVTESHLHGRIQPAKTLAVFTRIYCGDNFRYRFQWSHGSFFHLPTDKLICYRAQRNSWQVKYPVMVLVFLNLYKLSLPNFHQSLYALESWLPFSLYDSHKLYDLLPLSKTHIHAVQDGELNLFFSNHNFSNFFSGNFFAFKFFFHELFVRF